MQTLRAALRLAARTVGAASCFALAAPVGAQDTTRRANPLMAPGTDVRVRGRDLGVGTDRVTVVEQRGDTLLIRERGGALALVPLDRVTALSVADGRNTWTTGAGRGARVGALVGAIPSVVLVGAAAAYDVQHRHDPCSELCIPATPVAAAVGIAVTAVTTLVGTAIGAAVPGQRWRRVSVPLQVGAVPTHGGGTTIAFRVRF